MSNFLCINELTRWFGSKRALNNVSLQFEPGAVVGLVGPNGAGKTTLLNLLAGLIEPSHGTALLEGHSTRALPAELAAEVICVGDRSEPHKHCRLSDLIALQQDASPRFDLRLARQMFDEQNLSEKQYWTTLSKGQRRWSLAAVALASRPRLLLLDEPADGLDPKIRRLLYDHIRDFVGTGDSTALVSSHILADLQRTVDQLVVLENGQVVLNESLDILRDEVREVELPTVLDTRPLPEGLLVLARDSQPDFERSWVRFTNDDDREELELRADVKMKTVNLESLYLAIIDGEVSV